MLDGLKIGHRDPLVRDLTHAVKLLIDGKVPVEFAPYLAGASLFALDKTKKGVFDVRPIAASEILRRLVSKCLCSTHKKDAADFFMPAGQFGVACVAGRERVIHKVRKMVNEIPSKGSDRIMLKVDLRNAFNKVSRFHVLRLVKQLFPGIARWIHWCYGV